MHNYLIFGSFLVNILYIYIYIYIYLIIVQDHVYLLGCLWIHFDIFRIHIYIFLMNFQT